MCWRWLPVDRYITRVTVFPSCTELTRIYCGNETTSNGSTKTNIKGYYFYLNWALFVCVGDDWLGHTRHRVTQRWQTGFDYFEWDSIPSSHWHDLWSQSPRRNMMRYVDLYSNWICIHSYRKVPLYGNSTASSSRYEWTLVRCVQLNIVSDLYSCTQRIINFLSCHGCLQQHIP